ncbi:MAG TPA: hypothetical protein PLE71_17560 [Flavobacteriales bacterium]|nr:hypothetical protein [Flavobacteriales bacterium]HRA18679.1 hypothetical protein [Flavobacteriales bacterium]
MDLKIKPMSTYVELLPILKQSATRWVPELIVDEENETAVRKVLAWAIGHPSGGDAGKGLTLSGHRGSGKTLLMRALAAALGYEMYFAIHNTRKVTSSYNTDGDEGLYPYLAQRNMMFDDLGDERMGQHYGDKVEVMSLIIQDRYELFVEHGTMTHFTTNLTPGQLSERYGDRVYSRLKHMVNYVRVGSDENALDRRDKAMGPPRKVRIEIPPPVPVSPEVAAEHFKKIKETISEVRGSMNIPQMQVAQTLEEDALVFGQRIVTMEDQDILTMRSEFEKHDSYGSSKKFIEIIDQELLERREEDQKQATP